MRDKKNARNNRYKDIIAFYSIATTMNFRHLMFGLYVYAMGLYVIVCVCVCPDDATIGVRGTQDITVHPDECIRSSVCLYICSRYYFREAIEALAHNLSALWRLAEWKKKGK